MLDIIFTPGMATEAKKTALENDFYMRMTAPVNADLETMLNMELAIEARGRKEGKAEGIIETALTLHGSFSMIMESLTKHFHGSRQEAEKTFKAYLEEHPADGIYLEGTLPWARN